ncbi:MalY/PatB family protein [Bacillus sp. 1NLA3E]|uniref:MalY/PatB family protein n=1 Tax=Bacillus sp. 1NLA3E TaxID=666686 RepID=UPI000247EFC6|nr:PatB family C-S lyase [Bacillus sp. 1NLA3E]AGK55583.1 class I and II aminotransferase [Bacillus sp. 1NLA3E]
MIHNFDEMMNRTGTDSDKWDNEGKGGTLIPLGIADTDYKAPREVLDALRKKVDFGVFGYGYFPHARFTDAIKGWYSRHHKINIRKNEISYAPGLMTGSLWMFLDAYTNPGDKVVIQPPVYATFKKVIENFNRKAVDNPLLYQNGRYDIDFADLDNKLKMQDVKILLVCNPANPIGRVWTKEEMTRMVDLCRENNVIIISDEIHSDMIHKGLPFTSFLELCEEEDPNIVVMNSPSKIFNLASFFSAYVIVKNKKLKKAFDDIYVKYHFDYNYLGVEALITAYNQCDYYADELNEYLRNNIEFAIEFIDQHLPKLKVQYPECSYLLWIDCKELGLDSEGVIKFFEDFGVRVNAGITYGKDSGQFVRINIACTRSLLERALKQIMGNYGKCGF